jgi:hypothetical protein
MIFKDILVSWTTLWIQIWGPIIEVIRPMCVFCLLFPFLSCYIGLFMLMKEDAEEGD